MDRRSMNDRKNNLAHIILSNIDNICFMTDIETNEMLYVNSVVKKLLNIKGDEYIGRKCHEVIFDNSEACSFCSNKNLVKGEYFKWEKFNTAVQRHYELTDILFDLDGRDVKVQIGVDITDSKKIINKLQTKLALEETLIRCVQSLSSNDDMKTAINQLLEIIGDFYNADRAFIFEISNDKSNMKNTYEWNHTGISSQMQKLQNLPATSFYNWFDTLSEEDSDYIDIQINKGTAFNYEKYSSLGLSGLENLLATTLRWGNETIGFMGVANPKNNLYDKSLLGSVSLFVANAFKDKAMICELERLASTDLFSGLYNRNKYMQFLEQIISDQINSVGIVSLDINGLKQVNDEYGNENGDKLILKVVNVLKTCFTDIIFRTGGDEFIVLYTNGDLITFEDKVQQLRSIMNIQTDASISIGSTWCSNSNDIYKQIAYADKLMYVDKQTHYANRKSNQKSYKAIIANDLHDAIESNEFIIVLQPKIRLSDEKVVGAEALVRKKDGRGGLIPPDKFIPIYELDGVIPLIDFFVLETVCKLLVKWLKDGHPIIPISVNLSRITILEYNVDQKINNICKKYGIEPKYIIIELTEHVSNIPLANLNEILEKIKALGFQISLDDFGREYANLSILSNIIFNEIKLDKSLIDNIVSNPAIITAMQHLVKMFNSFKKTKLVIEGIETYEQFEILRESVRGIEVGQGYYFSRPLMVDDFLDYYLKNIN